MGANEPYLVAQVPSLDAEIWIYRDGGDISTGGRHKLFEDWDADSPEELRRKIVAYLIRMVVPRRTQRA